jgi:predicted GIY-YIG superfamily endonuclease
MSWFNKIQDFFKGKSTPAVDYGSLKVVELKAIAKEKGIKGYNKLRKAELVEALKRTL